ncbi:MAG TPA: FAD-binding oxidoreductase [Solirubrobacterales bacterium]|nr:FAD-binding oxidoreductase [Solirubrobacterales bacterium]
MPSAPGDAVLADLARELPGLEVAAPSAHHLRDAGAEQRSLVGAAAAVIVPRTVEQVQEAVAYCYSRDLPIVSRGGGSGLAGGAVPGEGAVVLDLVALDRFLSFEPELMRMHVETGVRTSEVRRRARENGLLFPPDPGAAEQSTIGGNVATNAGGPHAFRYGPTGAWVTGLEAVVADGERIVLGGSTRKLVDGLDLKSTMVGSEGVLGVITSVRLRLAPAPEAALPVAAAFATDAEGCAAALTVAAAGLPCAVLDFVDTNAFGPTRDSLPAGGAPPGFLLLAEVEGDEEEARRARAELLELLEPDATWTFAPTGIAEARALWRWRDDVSLRLVALHGGKWSEDVVVPPERLCEAIARLGEIGSSVGLSTCSWGHAGDGNLHATLFADLGDADQAARAWEAGERVLEMARELGGGASGEHGIGSFKQAAIAASTPAPLAALQRGVRAAFDPKGLFNPGKSLP